jgi:two-component system sensor histidine kinase/response regulator
MPVYFPDQQHTRRVPLYSIFGNRRLSAFQLSQLRAFTADYPLLVTDDDTMSRALHRAIFDQYDLRVVETRSSVDTLDICRKQPIALIISDIMKPHMDGLEMLQYLRADPRIEHIPLIFVTATTGTREIAFQLGADSFIRKPFHPHELLWEVWRLLSKRIK